MHKPKRARNTANNQYLPAKADKSPHKQANTTEGIAIVFLPALSLMMLPKLDPAIHVTNVIELAMLA